MQKRGIFSLVLLLALSNLFAAQDITDLGTAYELVIAETSLAEAETNTASSVSVITKEQIAVYNAQTTAELVGKAIGVSFNSVGSLGSLQNIVIRGATSSKNLVYLDGVLLSSAHEGTVDLSIIPVSIIERIEIVKSGPGNLGRTNAIGGMVNIITKKGQKSDTPFALTFENGSFLPQAYGAADSRNWLSLVDSQKLDFSYTNNELVATVGGLAAQNAYTYSNGSTRSLRDNAQVYEAHGAVNYNRAFSDSLQFNTQNFAVYKNLGVPGSATYSTPNNFMKDVFVSSTNTINVAEPNKFIENISTLLHYAFGQTYNHDAGSGDSTHNKYNASAKVEGVWNLDQQHALQTDLLYSLDYVDSTDVGQKTRHAISTSAHGSLYLLDGTLSLHPSLNIAYLSDLKALSPNVSLGAIYTPVRNLDLKATISYAERNPTFSELYWPFTDYGDWGTFQGNPNLKPEKGFNGDLGITYKQRNLSYEATLFGRNISNAIASGVSMPINISHSVYLGTEQSLNLELSNIFNIQASYLYNKSFDLSAGKTFSDNVEVTGIRKHTVKGSLFFTLDRFESVLSTEYLGKSSTLDSALLLNLSVTMQVSKALKAYLAVDNLLNTDYELVSGYPMPGTKIRLGGTLRF
jgi:outer membrane cobalamin receptor